MAAVEIICGACGQITAGASTAAGGVVSVNSGYPGGDMKAPNTQFSMHLSAA